MKRSDPPKRKTPLKRSSTSLKRTVLKPRTTPIKQRGAKAMREQDALDVFRHELKYRSGGECEVDNPTACGTSQRHRGVHAHHVWPEDRDGGVHDPERGLWVCVRAHDYIHDHPALSAEFGWLRPDKANE
jgi:hypothetical protein